MLGEFDNMLEWTPNSSTKRVAFIYATLALVPHCSKTDFSEKLFDSLLTFDFLGWVKVVTRMGRSWLLYPAQRISTLFQWLERWKVRIQRGFLI